MTKPSEAAPRRGWRRFVPRLRHVLWAGLGVIVLLAVLVTVGYLLIDVPDANAVATKQTTVVYYADGHTEIGRIGGIDRRSVPLSKVPEATQHAVLAAEDRGFYHEAGVSPTGILRALWVDVTGGDVQQGGSTITQQYAKVAYLSQKRTFTRKIKELFIAVKLDRQHSKNEILQDYLNTIYFGRGAYGIQTAAQAYFRKDVSQLNVAQGAFLAAVLNAPGLYDPAQGADAKRRAVQRWHYVIDGMVQQHWLSPQQASTLSFPDVKPPPKGHGTDGPNGFVIQAVKKELAAKGFDENRLNLGGYKVITTIQKKAQDAAIAAEKAKLGDASDQTLSALVAVQPGNGAIRAMYGGRDYANPKIPYSFHNAATEPLRQPGSSFKPYVLLAALKDGYGLRSEFDGSSPKQVPGYGKDGTVSNDSNEQCYYPCSLVEATARSINTVYVPLAIKVGPDQVVKTAYAAGIPKADHLGANASIALGTSGVHPIDQAVGYATIAAQGKEADPYLVSKVVGDGGDTVYAAHPHAQQVLDKGVADDATYAMEQVIDSPQGTAHATAPLADGRPAAGKTGTTTDNKDAWFVGFTPQLATAVWVGNADGSPLTGAAFPGGLYGGQTPAAMWKQFMDGALAGTPIEQLPSPQYVGQPKNSPAPPAPTQQAPTGPATTPTQTATPSVTATPSGPSGSAAPTATPTLPVPTGPPAPSSPPPTQAPVTSTSPQAGSRVSATPVRG